jgi:hypothetical protein
MIDVTLCAAALHYKSHAYDILIVGVTSVEMEKGSEPLVSGTCPYCHKRVVGASNCRWKPPAVGEPQGGVVESGVMESRVIRAS